MRDKELSEKLNKSQLTRAFNEMKAHITAGKNGLPDFSDDEMLNSLKNRIGYAYTAAINGQTKEELDTLIIMSSAIMLMFTIPEAARATKEAIKRFKEYRAEKKAKKEAEQSRAEASKSEPENSNTEFDKSDFEMTNPDNSQTTQTGAADGAGKLNSMTPGELSKLTPDQLKKALPDGWIYSGSPDGRFTHIRDSNGIYRIRIDPADKVTAYPHIHIFDDLGNALDINGNIVPANSLDAHIAR